MKHLTIYWIIFAFMCCINAAYAIEMVGFNEHLECEIDCEQIVAYEDCDDAWNDQINKINYNGIYVMQLHPRSKKFGAQCERVDEKPWTIFQRRVDGSVDFYRNWNAYKYGFGDVRGEYWLGLERLHQITKDIEYELWIHLKAFDGSSINYFYRNFKVASENEGYALTAKGNSGRERDALGLHDGAKFTTYDIDNDLNPVENCANNYRSAWWFKGCGWSDLNAPYKTPEAPHNRTIFWAFFHSSEQLKEVHMAFHKKQDENQNYYKNKLIL